MNQQESRRNISAATKVLRELEKHRLQDASEGTVFLAISGGIDSMTLLEAFHRLPADPASRARVVVVHVNHSLRGAESDADERLVLARAKELGFAAKSFRLEWNVTATQDRCRQRREEIFRELCRRPGDRVWLAHHLNDQAETVFFRLLRGTGARGLRGMLPVNGRKIRPFLALSKGDLRRAAAAWQVPWREDRTNLDSHAYERNWIRGFFPLLEARRPGFQEKLAALATEAQGWRFLPAARPDRFEYQPGVTFARYGESPKIGALAEEFGLSRLHAGELHRLLQKPSGRLEAERARFFWSGGLLLWEHGSRFRLAPQKQREGGWNSALGAWTFSEKMERWSSGAGAGAGAGTGGEKLKKEFQSLRVPLFFRGGIPVARVRERPVALLPRRIDGLRGVRFAPSSLTDWWLKLQDR